MVSFYDFFFYNRVDETQTFKHRFFLDKDSLKLGLKEVLKLADYDYKVKIWKLNSLNKKMQSQNA